MLPNGSPTTFDFFWVEAEFRFMLFDFELLAPNGSLLGMTGSSLSQPPPTFANGSAALAGADGFEAPPRSSWDPKAFENGSFYAGFAVELPPKISLVVEELPPKRSSCFVG